MHIITHTPRLVIREFFPGELETYLHHFTDEEICVYLPKRTTAERINIFQTALLNYSSTKLTGIWGMFSKESGEFVGSCLLRPFDDDTKVLELGYSLDKKHWGQGIATEMAQAMIVYGFSNTTIDEVVAVTVLQNIASQHVLEKAGFKRADNLLRDGLELAFFRKARQL